VRFDIQEQRASLGSSSTAIITDATKSSEDGPSGLISWHQSRKSLKVITDEDFRFFEEEDTRIETKVPLEVAHNYSGNYYCRCLKPKAALHYEVKVLRYYRVSLQKKYHSTLRWIEWLQLPGRDHEKAKGHNYLAYQLWILTYATINLPLEALKKLDSQTVRNLEDSLVLAESMAVTATKYIEPLSRFIDTTSSLIDEMNEMVNAQNKDPGKSGTGSEILNMLTALGDSQQQSIFIGNRIRHFAKLHLYTREPTTSHWRRFTTASEKDQVGSVSSGFVQFVTKLKNMNKSLEDPLIKLRKAFPAKCACGNSSFVPHLFKMHRYLQEIAKNDMTPADTNVLERFMKEVTDHVQYIFETGQSLVSKTKELLYYTRLCYIYLIEVCEVPAQPYTSLMEKHFPKARNLLVPFDAFESVDFFYVSAPDILRKVPVIFNVKQEWALQYEYHENS